MEEFPMSKPTLRLVSDLDVTQQGFYMCERKREKTDIKRGKSEEKERKGKRIVSEEKKHTVREREKDVNRKS